jgi:hypothetical protein
MKDKLIIEAISLIIFLLIATVVFIYLSKRGPKAQADSEQDAHLKRLFGPAWKAAKDL